MQTSKTDAASKRLSKRRLLRNNNSNNNNEICCLQLNHLLVIFALNAASCPLCTNNKLAFACNKQQPTNKTTIYLNIRNNSNKSQQEPTFGPFCSQANLSSLGKSKPIAADCSIELEQIELAIAMEPQSIANCANKQTAVSNEKGPSDAFCCLQAAKSIEHRSAHTIHFAYEQVCIWLVRSLHLANFFLVRTRRNLHWTRIVPQPRPLRKTQNQWANSRKFQWRRLILSLLKKEDRFFVVPLGVKYEFADSRGLLMLA